MQPDRLRHDRRFALVRDRLAIDEREGAQRRVRIEKENTTIIDGAGKKQEIEGGLRRSRRRSRKRNPTMTARSCRSV
jgi:hypothetical protein